jgi:hypothetical protein
MQLREYLNQDMSIAIAADRRDDNIAIGEPSLSARMTMLLERSRTPTIPQARNVKNDTIQLSFFALLYIFSNAISELLLAPQ